MTKQEKQAEVELIFAGSKTPNGIVPAITLVDVKDSGFIAVDGTVVVPNTPLIPMSAGAYSVTWDEFGNVKSFSPKGSPAQVLAANRFLSVAPQFPVVVE